MSIYTVIAFLAYKVVQFSSNHLNLKNTQEVRVVETLLFSLLVFVSTLAVPLYRYQNMILIVDPTGNNLLTPYCSAISQQRAFYVLSSVD